MSAEKKKEGPRLLTFEELSKATTRIVQVPEFGGAIKVLDLDAGEVLGITDMPTGNEKTAELFRMVKKAILDDAGEPMFTDETVRRIPVPTFMALQKAITSGLGGDEGNA